MEFEWHDVKAEANFDVHGVSFELAKAVFKDSFSIGRIRIISARRATRREQDDYYRQNA